MDLSPATIRSWFGIFPTPTWEFLEGFWGLRHIEKTPADLYRTDSSRDFGVGLQGSLNQSQSLRYSYQFGNESSTNSEIDKNKANRFSVGYAKPTGFAVEGFYGHFARDGDTDRSIYQIFAGYRQPRFRAAFQYYRNTRNVADGNDLELDLYSGFGVFDIVRQKVVGLCARRQVRRSESGRRRDRLPADRSPREVHVLPGRRGVLSAAVGQIQPQRRNGLVREAPRRHVDQDRCRLARHDVLDLVGTVHMLDQLLKTAQSRESDAERAREQHRYSRGHAMTIKRQLAAAAGVLALAGGTLAAADDPDQRRGGDLPLPDLLEVVQRVQQAATRRCRSTTSRMGSGAGIRQLTSRTVFFGATDGR